MQQQERPGKHRTSGHDQPFVAPVDPVPDHVGTKAFSQQSQAERERALRPRHTQRLLDRPDQKREGIEHAAPGDQLGHGEPQDQMTL